MANYSHHAERMCIGVLVRWRWRCACGVLVVWSAVWCVLWCVLWICCCVVFWLPLRVTVTPVVCQRLFEFLTTLTFRALGRNHIVSTAFETIAKKKEKQDRNKENPSSTRGQQCIMNRQEPKLEGYGAWKKKDLNVNGCTTKQNDSCNQT